MTKPGKFSPKQRRQSRRALLQALYQWDLAKTGTDDLQQFMVDEGALARADKKYFTQCLQGIMRSVQDLDRTYEPYLDRSFDDITPVERACLRAGSFELLEREGHSYTSSNKRMGRISEIVRCSGQLSLYQCRA